MFTFPYFHTQDDGQTATDHTPNPHRKLRKSRSYNVVTPLVDLVRDPVASVGGALGVLGKWQQDAKEKRAAEETKKKELSETEAKKQILSLRMKEVCLKSLTSTSVSQMPARDADGCTLGGHLCQMERRSNNP